MPDRSAAVFSVLMATFVVVLVLTNIIGVKLFLAVPEKVPNGFFGEAVSIATGLLAYPITFLVTVIVCEGHSRRRGA